MLLIESRRSARLRSFLRNFLGITMPFRLCALRFFCFLLLFLLLDFLPEDALLSADALFEDEKEDKLREKMRLDDRVVDPLWQQHREEEEDFGSAADGSDGPTLMSRS